MKKNRRAARPTPAQLLALGLGVAAVTLALKQKQNKPAPRKFAAPAAAPAPMGMRRALVVGLGIGGMSAALGLKKAGWDVQIVERAPERRTGGYFIGLSGEGFAAAEYFGVKDALHTHTPADYTTWEVGPDGKRRKGMNFTDQPNRPEVVLRGDIEEALWTGVERENIPVRFATVPVTVGSNPSEAVVRLKNTATNEVTDETFDLVVGADGVRSSVRREVFGPDDDYMKPLGMMICAFQMQEQMPGMRSDDGLIAAEEGRSVWFFPFADRPPTAIFTYRPEKIGVGDINAQFKVSHHDALAKAYAGMTGGGAVQFALEQFDKAPNALFDSVNMVDMPRWSHNRVLMLGDAAWCLTLYSGYGATSAMHGGAVLGQCLSAESDVLQALSDWEAQMRPFIAKQRRLVPLKAQVFVPSNGFAFGLRTTLLSTGLLPKGRALIARRIEARTRLLNRIFGERVQG